MQDPEIRCLQQSSLGIDAAPGQSRDVSPWAGHNALAATRCAADPYRPDALLSRARHCSGRVVREHHSNFELTRPGKMLALPHLGHHPNNCMDKETIPARTHEK